ncbi:MAG: hypothetical protein KAS70_02500 [Planctomycetes bacterium]|nr:hypothetical protein [Planctomycetota bacterium]
MISIIRVLAKDDLTSIWDEIIRRKDELQSSLQKKGQLLYLTKRTGYNEASLFMHVKELPAVSELITAQLSKIKGVSGIWVIQLFRPKFFPLPRDTHTMKRFVITAKVAPESLADVYKQLLNPNMPDGLKKVYYAFTFHFYDDCLQFSLLADKEETVRKYVADVLAKMTGVLKTNIYPIEKTKPFITYDEWQAYAKEGVSLAAWNHMLAQFRQ